MTVFMCWLPNYVMNVVNWSWHFLTNVRCCVSNKPSNLFAQQTWNISIPLSPLYRTVKGVSILTKKQWTAKLFCNINKNPWTEGCNIGCVFFKHIQLSSITDLHLIDFANFDTLEVRRNSLPLVSDPALLMFFCLWASVEKKLGHP